ncbi:MAG: hypothetical protein ABI690_09855 [Chloroflexota bacterium]
MTGISPEVTTLCLLALGVGIMILFAGFILVRLMKGSIFGLGMMAMKMISEPKDEEGNIPLSVVQHHNAQELRAQAQAIDFDAAVAKHRQDGQAQAVPPPGTIYPNAPTMQPPPPQVQGFPPPKPPQRDDGTLR